jgi:hypothetical protein
MQKVQYNPNRFLRQWMLSALCVWPVVGLACFVLWSPITLLFAMLGGYSNYEIISQIASFLSLLIMPGFVIGFFVGNFQRNLLLDELFWEIDGWQRQSIIGAIFGGCLVIFGSFLQIERGWFFIMPVFVFGLSSAQWFSLRHQSRDAWLWILGNVAAGIVFSSLMPQQVENANPLIFLGLWAVAAAAQGLITGVVMLYLYERPLQEEGRELAPVYIEVRNRNQR